MVNKKEQLEKRLEEEEEKKKLFKNRCCLNLFYLPLRRSCNPSTNLRLKVSSN
jgi:hypothetical protein